MIFLFILFHIAIAFYLQFKLLSQLQIPRSLGLFFGFLILVICNIHVLSRLFLGGLNSPSIPAWLIMSLGWLYASFLMLACLFIILDLYSLLVALVRGRIWHYHYPIYSLPINFSLLLIVFFFSAFGVWRAVSIPKVKEVTISIKDLPASFEGYRIVQLSDTHISPLLNQYWLDSVVKKVDDQKPDLIVHTGDFADGTVKDRQFDVDSFKNLSAPDGIYGVLGNHEYFLDYTNWIRKFSELGIHLLNNEHHVIQRGSDQLILAGVTDSQANGTTQEKPNLAKALQGVPANQIIILMDHRPGSALANSQKGVSLQLSGHTHGGHILGFNLLVSALNHGFVSGLYTVNNMKLYVSNGTGLWDGFPIRLGVESEITVIKLTHTSPDKTTYILP